MGDMSAAQPTCLRRRSNKRKTTTNECEETQAELTIHMYITGEGVSGRYSRASGPRLDVSVGQVRLAHVSVSRIANVEDLNGKPLR